MAVRLSREQIRAVDSLAVEEYHVHPLVLMENAGRNAARVIRDILAGLEKRGHKAERVLAVCGSGNNGGDGLVVARHLANCGINVQVALTADADRCSPDAAANLRICQAMHLPIDKVDRCEIGAADVVVDAMLGTGFSGDVREPLASVIRRINEAKKCGVIAIDVPSGLDCDTGEPANVCIVADATVTFVAEKIGFARRDARRYTGEVHVRDIGAPRAIVEQVQSRCP